MKKSKSMVVVVDHELYAELKRLQTAIKKAGGLKKTLPNLLVSAAKGNIKGIKDLTEKYKKEAVSNAKKEIGLV